LKSEAKEMITRLIEAELGFVKRRDQIKRELLKREDFVKLKAFDEIAQEQDNITLENLI
jgi:hypothetical protein